VAREAGRHNASSLTPTPYHSVQDLDMDHGLAPRFWHFTSLPTTAPPPAPLILADSAGASQNLFSLLTLSVGGAGR